MKSAGERALQKTSGPLLAEWLNSTRDAAGRQAVAEAIRYMLDSPSTKLPPKGAAFYFAKPLSMCLRILDGQVDLYPEEDRSYGPFHFWRVYTAGLLGRIRRCPQCQEWFYAVRTDKKWCDKHRQTTERDTLRQRVWRIENTFIPNANGRIAKYEGLRRKLTKAEQGRLDTAKQRMARLRKELKAAKAKLKALPKGR
jgi:hypothetical protein